MPDFKGNDKYSNLHGHSYEVTIFIKKKIQSGKKWVMNFDDLDKIVEPLLKKLDHKTLNNVSGLEQPTSENIARWLWKNILKKTSDLDSIEIIRPRIGGCIYNGE